MPTAYWASQTRPLSLGLGRIKVFSGQRASRPARRKSVRSPTDALLQCDEPQSPCTQQRKCRRQRGHGLRPVAAAVMAKQDVAWLRTRQGPVDAVLAGLFPVAGVQRPIRQNEVSFG